MSAGLPVQPYLAPPPGLLGRIAAFIYQAAPRPVPEIALAGALGFLAGIAGRSYNISGTGLNLYVLLLAETGTGKESIASGINLLMKEVRKTAPSSDAFIGPGEIASYQALIKALANTSPCFVSIVGEFGLALQQMSNAKAPQHLVGLRRVMLDLYNKSGHSNELNPMIYSDKEKNTPVVRAPSFSIIGESTPSRFYDAISDGLVLEGLVPRFTVIEYSGIRPPSNKLRLSEPPAKLTYEVAELCAHSLMLNSQNQVINVQLEPEAQRVFDLFDVECDDLINSAEHDASRHLWNRAHIKALKIAAIVAVGENPLAPAVKLEHAEWAISLEKVSATNLLSKFKAGEVGGASTEDVRIERVIAAFIHYLTQDYSVLKNYDVRYDFHDKRIVTYTYLYRRLCNTKPFRKDGYHEPSELLKRALKTLAERGDIAEMSRSQATRELGFNGTAYVLVNLRLLVLPAQKGGQS